MGPAERNGAQVARRQQLGLSLIAILPDRPDRMDDVSSRQPISFGDLGVAGLTAAEPTAFHRKLRAGSAMDCTIHPATAEEGRVGRVDDGVNPQCRNIGDDDFESGRADGADQKAQAEAAVLSTTPLSVKSCCSSPVWNISRTMSQPPTNSPLT